MDIEEQIKSIDENILNQLRMHISQALEQIGLKLQRDAVLRLREGNKQAWNTLIDSITYEIINQHGLQFLLKFGSSVKHAQYVEKGRPAGSFPPIGAIQAWVRQKRHKFGGFMKGLSEESAAFLAARKIQEKGVAPYPFLSWAVNQNQKFIINKLNEALAKVK